MQSRLPVSDLGRIWELADVTRKGSLSMAEFILAMFLAQSRIKGKGLPDMLPATIVAEVNSANARMGAQQQQAQAQAQAQVQVQVQMPTPAPAPAPMQQQMQMPMQMQQQMQRVHTPMMPMGSGASSSFVQIHHQQSVGMPMPSPMHFSSAQLAPNPIAQLAPNPIAQLAPNPIAQLASDPSAPESVLDFEANFPSLSPQDSQGALNSVRQSFHQNILGARANEGQHQWAISAQEKAQYETVFRRWDSGRRGVLKGDQAREVFAQAGLAQAELAQVWALADINNQGELNLDEFSVAMHLIFRRLAGAPLPRELPRELVPRSSKDFMASLLDIKEQLLFKDVTPVAASPLRATHRNGSAYAGSSNGDYASDTNDDFVYKSANRRKANYAPSPATPTAEPSKTTLEAIEQLRNAVRGRKADIQRLRTQAERQNKERAESRVTARWRIDDMKREIEDIHRTTPLSISSPAGSQQDERGRLLAKRAQIAESVNDLVQRMPGLVAEYKRVAKELADTKKDVVKRRANAKQSGGGGSDMESRAARLVAQRMAALTGETMESVDEGQSQAEADKLDRVYEERLDRVQTITGGLAHVQRSLRDLKLDQQAGGGGSRKWENANNEEIQDLVSRLRRIEQVPVQPPAAAATRTSAFSPVISKDTSASAAASKPESQPTKSHGPPSIADRLAQAKTKQERDQILQDMAEERFRERQRALGLPETEPEPEPPVVPQVKEPTVASNPFGVQHQQKQQPQQQQQQQQQPQPAAEPKPAAGRPNASGDSDSEEEWDRDESSDDESVRDLNAEPPFASGAGTRGARAASVQSSISFNTAFANPSAANAGNNAGDNAGGSNPFASLLLSPQTVPSEHENLRLRALYPYAPDTPGADELTIDAGDLLETRPVPASLKSAPTHAEGWIYGEILRESMGDSGDGWDPSGKIGWFPKDYAESLGGPGSRGWVRTKARFGTAKYAYAPQHEDELEIKEGDRVRVLDGDSAESWWRVRIIGQRTAEGMLPAMYIDLDK
ncbi:hypothetical protein BX661DRAFT_200287 [Kickxella alabastrina]|uniref:uncharacterized protein n=1 Tax=Kickxella alabastrina TaxID=61397 RepID=UPI002220ABAC|nr:uncharacterized protein BX661DRAFT_200287 [Kickxella alabastrina]KAI7822764.1 hypothetical protein BX661DRAFT_200287 [Kickxella alabastrina]